MATYNLGRFILNPRGAYNSAETYNKLDVVLYNGSSYICKSDNTTNKVPTNTTYWQLLAQAGQAVLTPQQEQEIIQTLIDGGVVVDPNYNTFTSEEKQKLAGLTNPNNGTFTINYAGQRLGTFNANQSTNTTVNVPAPNDAEITLVREDDPTQVIGKFTTNQKENDTIVIPIGGGTGTANNGQLTIQQGGNTIGTFTANQATNTTVNIPNNVLTIQVNSTTVGTYTPSATQTVNISVPENVSELDDAENYPTLRSYTSDTDNTTSDTLDGDCLITKLQSNYVYYCTNATQLIIEDYDYDTTDEVRSITEPVTYIYIECRDDFSVSTPTNTKVIREGAPLDFLTGCNYLITVIGNVWKAETLA